MKKRLLFVDDEPMILQGLQRMLRPMRESWEMEFVTSGALALERMAQTPFDVVVSDMRMPGMNGAQLLNEVLQRYPKTVRLILSGFADRDLILKCVGSTHQYLAKPCDPETLKATIQRMSSLDAMLQSERLRQLVSQLVCLPSIPSLYSEMVEALQEPDVHLDTIASIVVRDIAMTATMLKLANSAFFGLRRAVTTAGEAVSYIGLDTTKSLVLSVHAFGQYAHMKLAGFSIDALWTHSLKVGCMAKALVHSEKRDPKMADEAFIAGLLHDVGKLVLAANLPEEYERAISLARAQQVPLPAAEQEVFGANHADVGGYLLGLWGLPVPVVEAIALHHEPSKAITPAFGPLTAVHAADILALDGHSLYPDIPPNTLDTAYLQNLGLHERISSWPGLVQEHPPETFRDEHQSTICR